MVAMVGIEPTRPRGHWILNPARLPIPPHRHIEVSFEHTCKYYYTIQSQKIY